MSEQLLLYILKNDRKDDASYNNDCFRSERGKITVSFQWQNTNKTWAGLFEVLTHDQRLIRLT